MSMLGTGDFERSAEVDEEIWHQHFCAGCNSYWKHHNEDCEAVMTAEWPCPICEDSGDPDVRERL